MENFIFFPQLSKRFKYGWLKRVIFILLILGLLAINIFAQFGNNISGFVFNSARQPLSDLTVELLDEYSRTISRTKTNASGQYRFSGMQSGRFRIRVLPSGLDFSEQEQDVEIQNLTMRQPNGNITTGGFENIQRDFYLRPRKDLQKKEVSGVIFVQEVPQEAKKKYQRGIELLNNQKKDEAYKELKSAIEMFPTYFDALELLGVEYVKSQYFVPAEILLYNAVEVNPRSYKSWYSLAFAQYSQNKVSSAIPSIEKALALSQNSVEAFLLYGVLERKKGDFVLAEKNLLKAKEVSKGSIPEVFWQLALLYANYLNRDYDAIKELESYIKLNPSKKDIEKAKELIVQIKLKSNPDHNK